MKENIVTFNDLCTHMHLNEANTLIFIEPLGWYRSCTWESIQRLLGDRPIVQFLSPLAYPQDPQYEDCFHVDLIVAERENLQYKMTLEIYW